MKLLRRCLALSLAFLMVLASPRPSAEVSAALPKSLLLEQAQNLAVSNSSDITQKSNEIILQEMKYVEAVDGIKAKVKNLRSFRWSPLLSFKFPEQLNMTEEYELNVKPLTLQAEIDTLRHEMNDLRYQAIADASIAYTDAYILQEKIAFNEERLASAQEQLAQQGGCRLHNGLPLQGIGVIQKAGRKAHTLGLPLFAHHRLNGPAIQLIQSGGQGLQVRVLRRPPSKH